MLVVITPVREAPIGSLSDSKLVKKRYNTSLLSDKFPQSLTNEVLTLDLRVQAVGKINIHVQSCMSVHVCNYYNNTPHPACAYTSVEFVPLSTEKFSTVYIHRSHDY